MKFQIVRSTEKPAGDQNRSYAQAKDAAKDRGKIIPFHCVSYTTVRIGGDDRPAA